MRTLALLLATAGSLTAAELVNWNLDAVTGPAENNTPFAGVAASHATVADKATVGDLVSASSPGHNGLVWSGGNPGPNKLNLQRWDHPNNDPAQSGNGNGTPNNWLQFAIGSAPGFALKLQSVEIAAWRNGTGAPASWAAQTSIDNGATWRPFGTVHTQSTYNDFTYHPVVFSGMAEGAALLVRFIGTGPVGGTGNLHLNRLVLNGTVQPLDEPPPVPVVTIAPAYPLIAPGQVITLTSSIEGAAVFYTLDGSPPDASSTPYTGPFPLAASATVRAVAIGSDNQPGPVASRDYTVSQPIGTPNLLVIVGNEVGFGDLHCNGGLTISTNALDSLARDGIRFTQFTTTGGGAHAAQFALLSGRVAARSGLGSASPAAGAVGWRAEEWSLAEMLRRKGYQTAFVGEWLMGDAPGSHPNDQGFQVFHGLPCSLALNPPLVANRETVAPAPDPQMLLATLTARAAEQIAEVPEPFALIFQPPVVVPATGASRGGPHGRRIEALDAAIGQLLTAIASRGVADDTLVVFLATGGARRTADGGSNGLFRDGAGTTWEGGMRVPLLARLPGTLPAGQTNLSLLWLPDLMPTLAALTGAGLAPDRPLDGLPRPAAFTGATTRPGGNETAFGFRHHNGQWQVATVRQGKWKSHLAITNIDPENTNSTTGSQLYDLHIDAEERINRASQQPAVLASLAALAAQAAASLPPAGATDLPAPKDPVEGEVSTVIESNGSTTVRYRFVRPADSLDDCYQIEHSNDLSRWHGLGISPFITSTEPLSDHREDVEVAVPLGTPPLDGPARFIRLRAERPANP